MLSATRRASGRRCQGDDVVDRLSLSAAAFHRQTIAFASVRKGSVLGEPRSRSARRAPSVGKSVQRGGSMDPPDSVCARVPSLLPGKPHVAFLLGGELLSRIAAARTEGPPPTATRRIHRSRGLEDGIGIVFSRSGGRVVEGRKGRCYRKGANRQTAEFPTACSVRGPTSSSRSAGLHDALGLSTKTLFPLMEQASIDWRYGRRRERVRVRCGERKGDRQRELHVLEQLATGQLRGPHVRARSGTAARSFYESGRTANVCLRPAKMSGSIFRQDVDASTESLSHPVARPRCVLTIATR